MEFSFSDEQQVFRDMVRRFLEETSPTKEVRRLMDTEIGYDPAVWQRLSNELGLPGLHIPERFGGQGFGAVELGIVAEEMGRALLCAPFFSSAVLGTFAALNAASEAQREELLPDLAAGKKRITLAVAERSGSWQAADITTAARSAPSGSVLNGEKWFVIDGASADQLIVAAVDEHGIGLYLVDAAADGLNRIPLDTLDPTRKQARVVFSNVSAQRLGGASDATAALDRTVDQATIVLASEMVGGADHLVRSAVDYAQMRMQFGRVVGSFQAIKHKCADLVLEVELAKSAAYYAAEALAEDDPDVPALASLAKAAASAACLRAATDCIQIHGGIGFTWENDTHLYFKRAKASEMMLGDPVYHRERMLKNVGGLA
ncbi:MAG: acyl-CoA/acyl-ACP dehydrogenase [Proteobacteria bacterium]|nr:acyl-CoA/acyl-ACP dehydrogenase [Pseudomonadota bacterium]